MRKRILIMVPFLLLVVVASIAFCSWYFNPRAIFQRKFNFKLPNSVEILNKSYSFYYDSLEMKVCFDGNDYQKIAIGMKGYATSYGLYEIESEADKRMPTVRELCSWLNGEEEEFISAYIASTQGRWRAKTREICVLITQNNEGQYFLHVYN